MTPQHPRVLIAEHDPTARRFLADNLAADHYQPVCAADAAAAIELLTENVEALLVDVNGDTLAIIDTVRGETRDGVDPQLPILVLTSGAGHLHRTRLLERGADDVLAKPYSYPELRARIGALLRRAECRRNPRILRAGAMRIDVGAREVRVGDRPVELSSTEFALLTTLARDPTRVFTREELLRGVWGYRTPSRTVDSHAYRLRRKLNGQKNRGLVVNVWGVGYSLIQGEADPV